MRLTPEQRREIEERIDEINNEVPVVEKAISQGANLASSLELLHHERKLLEGRLADD